MNKMTDFKLTLKCTLKMKDCITCVYKYSNKTGLYCNRLNMSILSLNLACLDICFHFKSTKPQWLQKIC